MPTLRTGDPQPQAPLTPIDVREVEFYDDLVLVALVEIAGERQIVVPMNTLTEAMGLQWAAQLKRIRRDEILNEVLVAVAIVGEGGPQAMLALPLRYLYGWLLHVEANKVKEQIRDKIRRYQRECYDVLARAFEPQALQLQSAAPSPTIQLLEQLRDQGLAQARFAEEQIRIQREIEATNARLDKAGHVVKEIGLEMQRLGRRLVLVEQRTDPGNVLTEEQAAELGAKVRAVAMALTRNDPTKTRNYYQGIFDELYRRYRISSYKRMRQQQFEDAMALLDEWATTLQLPPAP